MKKNTSYVSTVNPANPTPLNQTQNLKKTVNNDDYIRDLIAQLFVVRMSSSIKCHTIRYTTLFLFNEQNVTK